MKWPEPYASVFRAGTPDARVCCLCGTGLDPASLFAAKWEPFADSVAHPGCIDDRKWADYKDQLDAGWDA